MNRRIVFSTFGALVTAVCLSGSGLAQSGPTGPAGIAPTTPVVNPVIQQLNVLSEQSVESALRALDPNLQVRPTTDGKGKVYDLKVMRDGWSYDLMIELNANDIWLNAKLSPVIAAPQNVSSSVQAELLKLNFKVGPTHFAFNTMSDNSGVRLFLCRLLDRRMTTETFNAYINDFLKHVKDTYPVWSQVR